MLSIALERVPELKLVHELPRGSVFSCDAIGLKGDIFLKIGDVMFTRLYSAILPNVPLLSSVFHGNTAGDQTGYAIIHSSVTQDFGVLTIKNVQEGAQ